MLSASHMKYIEYTAWSHNVKFKIASSYKQRVKWWSSEAGSGGHREMLVKGYNISDTQDE